MSNPFKTIDMLIQQRYRVPIAACTSIQDDWIPETLENNTVDLGELFMHVKRELYKLEAKNKELRDRLEMKNGRTNRTYPTKDQVTYQAMNEYNKIDPKLKYQLHNSPESIAIIVTEKVVFNWLKDYLVYGQELITEKELK